MDLRGNSLTNISAEVFDGFIQTNSLLHLDLSNNEISHLPDEIRNLISIRTLKITRNKFKCSCETFWMKEWLLNETQVVEGFENIKCQMKSGKWIPIVHMDKTDMGCVPTTGEPLSAKQIAGKYSKNHVFRCSNEVFSFRETMLMSIQCKRCCLMNLWTSKDRIHIISVQPIGERLTSKSLHELIMSSV